MRYLWWAPVPCRLLRGQVFVWVGSKATAREKAEAAAAEAMARAADAEKRLSRPAASTWAHELTLTSAAANGCEFCATNKRRRNSALAQAAAAAEAEEAAEEAAAAVRAAEHAGQKTAAMLREALERSEGERQAAMAKAETMAAAEADAFSYRLVQLEEELQRAHTARDEAAQAAAEAQQQQQEMVAQLRMSHDLCRVEARASPGPSSLLPPPPFSSPLSPPYPSPSCPP